mmetsp:Transcript_55114/g.129016  ORF Transcript_55114/g.129016 Transcript_55114/m.129016 type:complete len:228 (+) Transcript_55114:87-770(+)
MLAGQRAARSGWYHFGEARIQASRRRGGAAQDLSLKILSVTPAHRCSALALPSWNGTRAQVAIAGGSGRALAMLAWPHQISGEAALRVQQPLCDAAIRSPSRKTCRWKKKSAHSLSRTTASRKNAASWQIRCGSSRQSVTCSSCPWRNHDERSRTWRRPRNQDATPSMNWLQRQTVSEQANRRLWKSSTCCRVGSIRPSRSLLQSFGSRCSQKSKPRRSQRSWSRKW